MPGDRADQVGQHRFAARVDPVQVLDHQHQRLAAAGGVDQAADDPAQRRAGAPRAHLRHRAVGVGHAEEVEHQRQVLGEAGVEQQRPPGDLLARQLLGLALADPEEGAQHLQHRHVGDRRARGPGPAPRRPRARRSRQRWANSWQSRLLPTPGSATRPTTPPSPASARSSAARSAAISSAAPDEAREAARAREVEPRARRADAGQLEDADRLAGALDLELAEVLEVEEAGGELGGVLGQVGLARLGQRLHPLRQPDGVADRRVVAVAARADRPGDHLARVDPDPGREVEALRRAAARPRSRRRRRASAGRRSRRAGRGPRGRSAPRRRP